MVDEKFDVAIVGAGPAGASAAYILAKAGLKVIVVERGEYPGSKNVMGGVLYRAATDEIMPGFWREAPLERYIIRQSLWIMTKSSAFSIAFSDASLAQEPYNSFTVLRANFDNWFANKAREAGALIIPDTLVESLMVENGRVVGLRTDRPNGELRANVVLIAEGANSLLARDLGLHREFRPNQMTLAVKEVISLDEEVINARFNLSGREGATIELVGEITGGMVGIGFLYTNRRSISIGIGALISEFARTQIKPYELLDQFKQHPFIAPLIAGGESREYLAHMIPEVEYEELPRPYGDGFLIAGDAAGFGNVVHREGSNLAFTSGALAARAILRAHEAGDFSAKSLAYYKTLLDQSYIMKDMYKYRRFKHFLETHKHLFTEYPELLRRIALEFFIVDNVPKKQKQKNMLAHIKQAGGLLRIAKDLISGLRAFW